MTTDATVRLRLEGAGVRYAGRPSPALADVDLMVASGERVGLTGRTGAGKSTLALLAAGFIPRVVRATTSGSTRIDGIDASDATDAAALLGHVGIVFGTPANQLSASKPTVRDELAFGLENLGVPRGAMDVRIDAVLGRLGIAHLADREPFALSGGEQQRVAIASIVVMGPGLLVLDEPTAQLDPDGTTEVGALLSDLAADGTAILCAEHDRGILQSMDRVTILDGGRVVGAGSATPMPAAIEVRLDAQADRPVPAIEVEGLAHRYPGGIDALRGIFLRIEPGESIAIVGPNGSGKTTLAKHLNGLLRPAAGEVRLGGRSIAGDRVDRLAADVGFVFQDPGDQLFERSVEREVAFGPRNLGFDAARTASLVSSAIEAVGLGEDRGTNPYDLDPSRRKLVGLASVLAMDPAILVLDEPTTGQDPDGVARVAAIIRAWTATGRTAIAITHDPAFAASAFGRIVALRDGQVVTDGPPGAAAGSANGGPVDR